jgi:ATP-dependent RNA helicase DeaD
MGFAEDLEAILQEMPSERQTALFSATIPARISGLVRQHLREPVHVQIARAETQPGSVPRVRQTAYIVPRAYKAAALGRVLDIENPSRAIVFCRTRTEVDELTELLGARGYDVQALHGGMAQEQRDRVMRKFREGDVEFLVATDVAARGLDIEELTHVVNYDVPSAPEAYVHRIGRTGRAGREGVAITIAEPREHRLLRNIEQVTRQKIELATVPTVADLRARRLELLRASLREALLAGAFERQRVVVEGLAEEFDIMDVAAAAVQLLDDATGGDGQGEPEEIPTITRESRPPREGRERERGPRGRTPRERPARTARRQQRERPDWDVTRLYIGAGRSAGIRPGDLVGAIANEVGVDSSAVGAIDIADKFSLVEVPEEIAEEIIAALRSTTLKGRKVSVRRDRDAM